MSILPIDKDVLEANEAEDAKGMVKVLDDVPEEKVEEDVAAAAANDEDVEEEIFDKPKEVIKKELPGKQDPNLTATGKRRKRVLTEKQIEGLKKAREKSMARRKEIKAAKDLTKMAKKIEKEEKISANMEKEAAIEAKLRMAAKAKISAEKDNNWDEDRLMGLMEKTIENYIEKKKKAKPRSRESIPYPTQQPNIPPQFQQQQLPQQAQFQPQPQQYNYYQPTQEQPKLSRQQQHANGFYHNMFGNFDV